MAKLGITRCDVQHKGQVRERTGSANGFETKINLAIYKVDSGISDSGAEPEDVKLVGVSSTTSRHDGTNLRNLKLDIVLDGTGVVPDNSQMTAPSKVASLTAIAFDFYGERREPNVVKDLWGRSGMEPSFGRMTTPDVGDTLSCLSGEVLRAKASLALTSVGPPQPSRRGENRSSPDLTHLVTVVAGDTRPPLCDRTSQDPSNDHEVARHKGLEAFNLTAGTELLFRTFHEAHQWGQAQWLT